MSAELQCSVSGVPMVSNDTRILEMQRTGLECRESIGCGAEAHLGGYQLMASPQHHAAEPG